MGDQKWRGGECRDQPDTVADAVRDFFPERLSPLEYRERCAHDSTSNAVWRSSDFSCERMACAHNLAELNGTSSDPGCVLAVPRG